MVAEGRLGLGCRRFVCNKQIMNWGMPELPSVMVYGTAVPLLLLVMCRWSWGMLLLVLLKPRMVGGTGSLQQLHLPVVSLEERRTDRPGWWQQQVVANVGVVFDSGHFDTMITSREVVAYC
jgi:hypothetical protein